MTRNLIGLSLVERLTLQAQSQALVEERRTMAKVLASARWDLEDERQARAVELNSVRQTLDDAHAQSVAVAAEIEQLRKERDDLHGGLQTATQERDATLQEHDSPSRSAMVPSKGVTL